MSGKNTPWTPPADAPLPRPPEVPGQRKPSLKRYTWVRYHHELPGMDLWGLVAKMARSERAIVEAMVARLEIYASANRPRGCVQGFSVAALAVTWRRDEDELARVYAALEHRDVGWLEDDQIVTFWERNPDEEDATGAERARRSRARRKVIKEAVAAGRNPIAALDEVGLGYTQGTVTRDAVTVTTRSDQTKQEDGKKPSIFNEAVDKSAPQAIHRQSGGYGDPEQAIVWLAFHGKRIIAERLNEPAPRAQQRIERWLKEMADDAVALAALIDQAAASDAVVAQFLQLIGTSIRQHRHREKGPALPFGPTLAADSGMPKRRQNG